MGAIGAARPAVCEPSPNFCSVSASSFPVGLSPCASWNFLSASRVELSHLPLAVPPNDPSFANACCISAIRSGVGAFCPRGPRWTCLLLVLEMRRLVRLEAGAAWSFALLAVAGRAHILKVSATSKLNPTQLLVRRGILSLFSRAIGNLLLVVIGRHHSGKVHRQHSIGVPPPQHLEYHVFSGS